MIMKASGSEYGKFTVGDVSLRLSSLLVFTREYVIGMV